MVEMIPDDSEEHFSIGALAGIVGVPVETIRTWERRYGVPRPDREKGGRRSYPLREVERLRSIVRLVQRGERVRDLTSLDRAELDERLTRFAELPPRRPERLRLALIHPSPPPGLAGPLPSGARLELAAEAASAQALPRPLEVHAVLVHASALPADPGALLDELEAAHDPDVVLVMASFLPAELRRALTARGVRLVDEATRADALRQRVEDAVLAARLVSQAAASPASPPPGPIYARAELERLINSPSPLPCECPAHIAGLILRLREFERYSRQCAADTPAQVALHADLAQASAEAAALLEPLLQRAIQVSG